MLLVCFTLFNALQIFKLTMKLTIQPASVETERAFGAGGLFAMTPQSTHCASYEMCCQSSKVKNAWFLSYVQHWF